MDDDGIHKFAYGHDVLFADLLRLVSPALAAELDFTRAELLPTALVSAGETRMEPSAGSARGYPRMRQRHGDMMWRVPRRRDASDDAPADLIVVIEFQSTVDQGMATRMGDYCRMLLDSPAVRGREEPPPAVLPLLVYNGNPRWTAPGAVAELSPWSRDVQRTLAPFQQWDYVLLSLQQQLEVDDKLSHLPLANRSAATMRLQLERTPADLVARLRTERARFRGDADKETRNVLHVWAGALLAEMDAAKSTLPSENELDGIEELTGEAGETGEKHMTTVSQARYAEWLDGIRAKHVAEGVEQGRAEGERTVLRRLAERRFGAAAAPLYPLLDKVQSTARLEEIGEWLVAEPLDALMEKAEAVVADERITLIRRQRPSFSSDA